MGLYLGSGEKIKISLGSTGICNARYYVKDNSVNIDYPVNPDFHAISSGSFKTSSVRINKVATFGCNFMPNNIIPVSVVVIHDDGEDFTNNIKKFNCNTTAHTNRYTTMTVFTIPEGTEIRDHTFTFIFLDENGCRQVEDIMGTIKVKA